MVKAERAWGRSLPHPQTPLASMFFIYKQDANDSCILL